MGAPTRARWRKRKDLAGFVALGIIAGLLISALLGLSLGAWMITHEFSSPFRVIKNLFGNQLDFSPLLFAGMGIVALLLVGLFLLVRRSWKSSMTSSSWVDVAAQHMATRSELSSLSRKAATAKARELRVKGSQK